eukprot:Protomagalhaensia_wolfi_Nauph_80__2541@NODE_26_length_4698_cov_90_735351_g21_i0_p4_GENE_NODE_26_length_4698_cov_90_735351_g21_i0NODE_26_length_4698_cov_90_735351_g21_i0_p4_ORF_typecomplete_len169_score19_86CARD/PF00619_21/0_063Fer4_22/PF17179_4/0_078WASH_WAHD/PF11945_8/0_099_NODE_26_length_4698_cov_90_735351_g21_i019382444
MRSVVTNGNNEHTSKSTLLAPAVLACIRLSLKTSNGDQLYVQDTSYKHSAEVALYHTPGQSYVVLEVFSPNKRQAKRIYSSTKYPDIACHEQAYRVLKEILEDPEDVYEEGISDEVTTKFCCVQQTENKVDMLVQHLMKRKLSSFTEFLEEYKCFGCGGCASKKHEWF